jgi:hypothetical protein
MDHQCHNECECRVRLAATMDLLALSSARLRDVIFTGPEDAVESALVELRFAMMRVLARDDYREAPTQLTT